MSQFHISSSTLPASHVREYPHALQKGYDGNLQIAIKVLTPLNNRDPSPGDVTIVTGHANAFPKPTNNGAYLQGMLRAPLGLNALSGLQARFSYSKYHSRRQGTARGQWGPE
ncbi:MAG: hypothetical protein Q9222_006302 [Ikaeria aurantiellina]